MVRHTAAARRARPVGFRDPSYNPPYPHLHPLERLGFGYLAGEDCRGGGGDRARAGHGKALRARGCGEPRRHAAPGWTRKPAARPNPSASTARSRPPPPGAPSQGQAQGKGQSFQHPWGENLQPPGHLVLHSRNPKPRARTFRSAFPGAGSYKLLQTQSAKRGRRLEAAQETLPTPQGTHRSGLETVDHTTRMTRGCPHQPMLSFCKYNFIFPYMLEKT
uniref:Uncharacterized protein n=1 Tax=Sus scrofa TaxID=9823 RepID=A0A4X1VGV8_PIG